MSVDVFPKCLCEKSRRYFVAKGNLPRNVTGNMS